MAGCTRTAPHGTRLVRSKPFISQDEQRALFRKCSRLLMAARNSVVWATVVNHPSCGGFMKRLFVRGTGRIALQRTAVDIAKRGACKRIGLRFALGVPDAIARKGVSWEALLILGQSVPIIAEQEQYLKKKIKEDVIMQKWSWWRYYLRCIGKFIFRMATAELTWMDSYPEILSINVPFQFASMQPIHSILWLSCHSSSTSNAPDDCTDTTHTKRSLQQWTHEDHYEQRPRYDVIFVYHNVI